MTAKPSTNSTKLLPCPFCGCENIEIHSSGKPFYFAVCTNRDCEAEGPIDLGESGAAEKWNTRISGEA